MKHTPAEAINQLAYYTSEVNGHCQSKAGMDDTMRKLYIAELNRNILVLKVAIASLDSEDDSTEASPDVVY